VPFTPLVEKRALNRASEPQQRRCGLGRLALTIAAASLALGAQAEPAPPGPLDVLIQGGQVLVGQEFSWLNVGIRGDEIAYLGNDSPPARACAPPPWGGRGAPAIGAISGSAG
jgi:hypothetical protein